MDTRTAGRARRRVAAAAAAAAAAAMAPALLLGGCTGPAPRPPAPPPPAEPAARLDARAADERALDAAADRLGFLADHFVAVAGGEFLGGSMFVEDAARLIASRGTRPPHAFLFRVGEEGDRAWSLPAIYAGPGVAGDGLVAALGLRVRFDPATGETTLATATREARHRAADGGCRAVFRLRPASGLAPAADLELVVASGFPGTAFLPAEAAAGLALETCEIPGRASLAEALTGRRFECRRALVRVEVPDLGVAALVDLAYAVGPAGR